ncbi:hypothetical protein NPIL_687681, partial [Nephila pilipes]
MVKRFRSIKGFGSVMDVGKQPNQTALTLEKLDNIKIFLGHTP